MPKRIAIALLCLVPTVVSASSKPIEPPFALFRFAPFRLGAPVAALSGQVQQTLNGLTFRRLYYVVQPPGLTRRTGQGVYAVNILASMAQARTVNSFSERGATSTSAGTPIPGARVRLTHPLNATQWLSVIHLRAYCRVSSGLVYRNLQLEASITSGRGALPGDTRCQADVAWVTQAERLLLATATKYAAAR